MGHAAALKVEVRKQRRGDPWSLELTAPTIRLAVLWLTTRCNLRCGYCYMRGGEAAGEDMTADTLERVFKRFGTDDLEEVQLAGGEPSLVPERVEHAARLARSVGVERIGLQTNGVELDEPLLKIIRRYRIGIGISLDGPPRIHDALRGEAERTLQTLDRLECLRIPVGITAVVSRHNVATLPEFALLLGRYRCVRSLGLDVLRVAGRAKAGDLPTTDALREAYTGLVQALDWVNRHREDPIRLREETHRRPSFNGYCPAAGGHSVVVTPDASLYPCSSLVGDRAHFCGTLDQPDERRLTAGLTGYLEQCASCSIDGTCRGRCPARAALNPDAGRLDCLLRFASIGSTTPDAKEQGKTHV